MNSSSDPAEWKAFFCEAAPVWSIHYTKKKPNIQFCLTRKEHGVDIQNEMNAYNEEIILGTVFLKFIPYLFETKPKKVVGFKMIKSGVSLDFLAFGLFE